MRNMESWRNSGKSEFRRGNYEKALALLEKAYSEAEKIYPELEERELHIEDWPSLLCFIIRSHCQLRNFDEAKNMVTVLMRENDTESVTNRLADSICKSVEDLIRELYRAGNFDIAALVGNRFIGFKKNDKMSALDVQRIIAEIYLTQNKTDEAIELCNNILLAPALGQIEQETNLLLAVIFHKRGEGNEEMCRVSLLSETFKGKN